MGYNKFIKKSGEVLLDLTGDTVAADSLVSGITAHGRDGEVVTGTNPYNKTAIFDNNGTLQNLLFFLKHVL